MKDVVIASACRTAIGAFGGTLKDMHAAKIASVAMQAAVKRAGIDPALIDDVRFGCCMEPVDTMNVTRIAALLAGIPDTVTAATINRVCISSMEAVISGMAMIQAGMAEVILAGGVEHMSGAAYSVANARWGCRLQDQEFVDNVMRGLHCGSHLIPHPEDGPVDASKPPLSLFKGKPYIMGATAEFVAQHLDISREEMDAIALRSHNNVERATKNGDFRDEIIPVTIPQRKADPIVFDKDEHFRPGITLEQLAKLPPAFVPQGGKVTAGNSSGINDGAAAMLIMSAEKARELGITPLARIKAVGRGACHPSIMGLSPVPAVKHLLAGSGLKLPDFELIEVNEAFAAQYLGVERQLGLNREITNVNGSGIGLGHPVGATGARIMITLMHAMKKRGKQLGLATLCGGGGVSMACAIELL
jgi:acetyl-CoA C-acetyltransferase